MVKLTKIWLFEENMQISRAWPGGGVWRPPPLPNIRDNSKTNSAIDVKLGRPSHTTIWHCPWKFFWNPSKNYWDMVDFVTSLHATFGRKLAKLRGSVEDAGRRELQKRQWNVLKIPVSKRDSVIVCPASLFCICAPIHFCICHFCQHNCFSGKIFVNNFFISHANDITTIVIISNDEAVQNIKCSKKMEN